MGCAIKELYATNTNDETGDILLTSWIPEKRDEKYYWPSNTPLGFDMWIPNVIDLKEEEGITPVKIIESEEKTGLWIICADDYFGDEQYLYAHSKPVKVEGKSGRIFSEWIIDEDEEFNCLHVETDLKMKSGDGPISVTLKRI